MDYIFDGSYSGYLTGLFECFERSEWDATPRSAAIPQGSLFGSHRVITTDLTKAKRVQTGLMKQLGAKDAEAFFHVFLSENPSAWTSGYKLIQQVFKGRPNILKNFGEHDVLYFVKTLKQVNRERHRMKAFVRFSKCTNGLFFATVEPDFNVLPLIATFFKNRYADQSWLIFDVKRRYGILYDQTNVREVHLTTTLAGGPSAEATSFSLDERDDLFKRLWKLYFQSTNITARRNLKLHVQHVPKRYWKYLVEKN
ncbi:TIGR03915 family putative DNA repair protein [Parapedobacter soli]|uniref:TIGR03915 family putative DNA repair protein n=1 Tax=Parapedobacter soli TaxID=416955 RepID=UPI0021C86904|nr:TIGR03915 family putative DNA repair protein [Parapedobacter soli]